MKIPAADYLPLVATVIVLGVNAAANILPINGYNTGALSDLNPTGFTPAGWVFAIWSPIYLGMVAFALSQIFGGDGFTIVGRRVRSLYLINAAANVGWILAWHYRQVALSFTVMLVILGTLIGIFIRLRRNEPRNWARFALIDGPFSLYFGWITTATIANLGAMFFAQGFYPFGLTMDQWAIVSVALALATYVWVGSHTRDIVYCAVFVWASIGIYAKPAGITDPVRLIAITGTVVVTALVFWIAATSARDRRSTLPG